VGVRVYEDEDVRDHRARGLRGAADAFETRAAFVEQWPSGSFRVCSLA